MSDTNYVDFSAPFVVAAWLNDVNAVAYRALGVTGIAPATPAQVVANLNLVTTTALAASSGASLSGFLQAGVGAIATTVLAKERQTVSLFDYLSAAQIADVQSGAKTLDISAAIVIAVAAAKSLNAYLFAPPGNYRMNSGVTLSDLRGLVGVRSQSIFTPIAIAGTETFVVNTSLSGAGIPQTCVIDGISIDGTVAGANKIGLSVGTNALSGRVYLRGVESVGFAGATGQGLLVGNVVEAFISESLFSFSQTNVTINSATTGQPTTITFFKNNIRQAVGVGVNYICGNGVTLLENIIESNGQEGVKGVVAVGPQFAIGFRSIHNWYENNWAGAVTPQFQINVTGTTAPLNKTFVSDQDYFDCSNVLVGSHGLTRCQDFLIDNPKFGTVPTNAVTITTSSGAIDHWPVVSAPITTTLVAIDATSAPTVDFPQAPWISFAPTITPAGAMTFTGVSVSVARFRKVGRTLQLAMEVTGTVGGTPGTTFTITLPAGLSLQTLFGANAAIAFNVTNQSALLYPAAPTQVQLINLSTYTAGAGRGFSFVATLEVST